MLCRAAGRWASTFSFSARCLPFLSVQAALPPTVGGLVFSKPATENSKPGVGFSVGGFGEGRRQRADGLMGRAEGFEKRAEGFDRGGWTGPYIRVPEVCKNPSTLQPGFVTPLKISGKEAERFDSQTLQQGSAVHGRGGAGRGRGRRCLRPGTPSAPSRRSSPVGPGPRLKGLKGLKINPSATFSLKIRANER